MMRRLRRPRPMRAATTIMFILVGIPLLFVGACLAVDFTRVVLAQRQVSNAADAAAVAGAGQLEPRVFTLDQAAAAAVAQQTYSVADAAGQTRLASAEAVTVSTGDQHVTVQVTYSIPDLLFYGFFTGSSTADEFTVTRSADVCVPGDYDLTNGACRRAL